MVREWRDKHPDEAIPDGLVLTQPWPATSQRRRPAGSPIGSIHYQYRHDRARRTLRGIDEQVAKAERAVDGQAAVKRNRFIKLTGATKSVNRDLEAKTRGAGRLEGLHHQPDRPDRGVRHRRLPPAVAHREGFRMSKHDLQARPIYHRTRDSIDAHLSIVFAALAVSHWIEAPNRLEHQEIRPHRTPLPHRHDPSRTTNPDRRRTPTRRPRRSPRQNPRQRCALV